MGKKIALFFFVLGSFLIILGDPSISGAFIGFDSSQQGILFAGLFFLLLSIFSVIVMDKSSIDDLFEDIEEIIDEQKHKYRANKLFLEGLKEIEKGVEKDKDLYHKIHSKEESVLKNAIVNRLKGRKKGLLRREQDFFELPHHVKKDPKTHQTTIVDLPDRGLYPYRPIGGRKSKFVELDVVHYTDDSGYKGIKSDLERDEPDILMQDTTFGAYFVSAPLPENLPIRRARQILGIGHQVYVGKQIGRSPKYEISSKIKVRKERVLVKDSYYSRKDGGEISEDEFRSLDSSDKNLYFKVEKIAIAGGITQDDLVSPLTVQRYHHNKFDKEGDRKKNNIEKWDKST